MNDFVRAVTKSKLLTPAQKQEFLDKPEMLPEEYREKIIGILEEFERKALTRGARVKRRLDAIL